MQVLQAADATDRDDHLNIVEEHFSSVTKAELQTGPRGTREVIFRFRPGQPNTTFPTFDSFFELILRQRFRCRLHPGQPQRTCGVPQALLTASGAPLTCLLCRVLEPPVENLFAADESAHAPDDVEINRDRERSEFDVEVPLADHRHRGFVEDMRDAL
ncbi:hypothetical protein ATN37_01095 [Rhodococcus sp. MH15]|nr:hypothetical protein [Rhodococcus sp. MH15]